MTYPIITALPFAAGELESFYPLDSSCVEVTTSGAFDPLNARGAICVETLVTGALSPRWPAESDFWFRVNFYHPGGTEFWGEQHTYKFFENEVEVLWLNTVLAGGGVTVKPFTLQSGVMTLVGSFVMSAGLGYLDINLTAGASGACRVFVAGTDRLTVAGLDHSGFSGVDQVFLGPVSTIAGNSPCHSEIMCDNIAHVGDSLKTLVEDTASSINTGFSGAVGNINELVHNDANNVTSDTAGQVGTYYKAGLSLGAFNVRSVHVGVRAQMTAGSPGNLETALRTNGVNYFSPTIALDFGLQPCCTGWRQNPFTSADWSPSEAAIIEWGMKSLA